MCNDCRLAQVIRRFTMVVGNHMGVTPSHMICFPDLWLIFPHKHRMHVNSKAAVRDSRSSMWKNLRHTTHLCWSFLSWNGKFYHFVRYNDCMCMEPIQSNLHTLNANDHVYNRQPCRISRDGFPGTSRNLHLDMLMFVTTMGNHSSPRHEEWF